MVSYKAQRLMIVLTLFISTVFLYGCGSSTSSSVSNSSLRFEIRDVTTKAPLDNVQVMVTGSDPSNANGPVSILRQLKTDSRGKATASDLPPDRPYQVVLAKEGYQNPPNNNNVQPQFIPSIPAAGFNVEQGATYDIIGYLIRSDSPATGTIRGYVKNRVTGEPISNATVFTNAVNQIASVIDTTDKPSKPGYYELSNVPSGQGTVLNVTIPGVANVTNTVTIPGNGTIDYDIFIDPGVGTINGNILASPNEVLPPGTYVIQVLRNGTDIVTSRTETIGDTAAEKAHPYTIANVPVVMTGSTSSYTVKIVSDVVHMTNPAGGVSGITMRQTAQVVEVPAITVMSEKGTILLTLYHAPIAVLNPNGESDAGLSTMAPQASITVANALVESIFVNEGPTRFYRYRINNVPVGKRTLTVNFPGHNVSGTLSVNSVKDSEVSALFTLTEGAGGGAAPRSR